LNYVLAKLIYESQPFLNGFIWTRLGSCIAALLILLPVKNRTAIFGSGKKLDKETGVFVVGNKALGGIAFILLNLALVSGQVGLVNALQGIQYAFLFLLILILSSGFPRLLDEKINKKIIIQKVAAIILIGAGLVILAL